jgi:hypothetical protein
MGQLSLVYPPGTVGAEAWQQQLEVLRKAVEHLTRKEVAWALGVTDQALGDALYERDRKRWAAKWTHIVKAMLAQRHDQLSTELMRALCESDMTATPLEVGEPREMTPEEMVAALRRELAAMGDVGQGKRR